MSLEIIRGDLLSSDASAICHQVNCRCVMGAGVAAAIVEKWPIVKERYKKAFENLKDWHSLLGKIQTVKIGQNRYVVNIFGQDDYGHDDVYTDYSALNRAFKQLNKRFAGQTVAFPYGFGCGLGGGDWTDIERMMVILLPDCDVKIYLKG
jgi:O-acetyl-ADP-ribose deacetylase (regulator of RNase III)